MNPYPTTQEVRAMLSPRLGTMRHGQYSRIALLQLNTNRKWKRGYPYRFDGPAPWSVRVQGSFAGRLNLHHYTHPLMRRIT